MNTLGGEDMQGARLEISLAKVTAGKLEIGFNLPVSAAVRQEEKGGNVEEERTEDDAGDGGEVRRGLHDDDLGVIDYGTDDNYDPCNTGNKMIIHLMLMISTMFMYLILLIIPRSFQIMTFS